MKEAGIATRTGPRTTRPRRGGAGEPGRSRREFEQVALAHRQRLYRRALSLCRNAVDAEDLVQETYLRALTFFNQFAPGTNCRAWLMTILRHAFISRRARAAREVPGIDESTAGRALARCAGLTATPEEEFSRHTIGDRHLAEAVEALPRSFQEVVMLADVEERSYREIAQMCELPVGTVMSRLYRARRLLRKALRARRDDRDPAPASERARLRDPGGKPRRWASRRAKQAVERVERRQRDDERLVGAPRVSDATAVEVLVDPDRGWSHRAAARVLGDPGDIEDIIQAVGSGLIRGGADPGTAVGRRRQLLGDCASSLGVFPSWQGWLLRTRRPADSPAPWRHGRRDARPGMLGGSLASSGDRRPDDKG